MLRRRAPRRRRTACPGTGSASRFQPRRGVVRPATCRRKRSGPPRPRPAAPPPTLGRPRPPSSRLRPSPFGRNSLRERPDSAIPSSGSRPSSSCRRNRTPATCRRRTARGPSPRPGGRRRAASAALPSVGQLEDAQAPVVADRQPHRLPSPLGGRNVQQRGTPSRSRVERHLGRTFPTLTTHQTVGVVGVRFDRPAAGRRKTWDRSLKSSAASHCRRPGSKARHGPRPRALGSAESGSRRSRKPHGAAVLRQGHVPQAGAGSAQDAGRLVGVRQVPQRHFADCRRRRPPGNRRRDGTSGGRLDRCGAGRAWR